LATVLALTSVSAACGSSDEVPTLAWYINPDNGGQAQLARSCTEEADGRYRIRTALLPNDADGQREQLVRRLAANDSSIDLMSLDVVFVPEFANAGFVVTHDGQSAQQLTDGMLDAPVEAATWEDELAAVPFTANTQLLWYRKSVAARAGIDPASGPVTWDDIIAAGEQTGTTVEVTGDRYEGYMVWINALTLGAGGEMLDDTDTGADAVPRLDSEAGRAAATIVRKLARSSVADPQLSTATEETARAGFQASNGGFMTNWPYIYEAAQSAVDDGSLDRSVLDDIAWARYPQTVAGTDSAPPLGGVDLAIGAFTKHPDLALEAVQCLTSEVSQTAYMLAEGIPAARGAVYDQPDVKERFPMAALLRESNDSAGPRPLTPYYPDVSSAVVRVFHPPANVQPDRTPAVADRLVVDVLQGRALL